MGLAVFNQCQCVGGIPGIPRQHVGIRDQLAFGIHSDCGFMTIKPFRAAFAPVPHLLVMHRNDPILADAFFQLGLSLWKFHILRD